MITEEMIKQTRFFHSIDGQEYMVSDVRSVKIVTLINCSDGQSADLILGDDVCKQFAPVKVQYMPINQPTEKPEPIEPATPPVTKPSLKNTKKNAGKGPKKDRKLPPRKKSKYKGVSPLPPTKDGTIKFSATYWDGKKGKSVHMGTFENELNAAAAYQDHIGDKAEAARLRAMVKPPDADMAKQSAADMAEQAENNPDKPPHRSKLKTWQCYHCKITLRHPTQPLRCIQCDSASFKEI